MANTKPELRSKVDKRVIEYVSTSSLTPYARNSRTHSPQQVKQIAASIKEFGFTNPVLIDDTNGIIAGHGRVMAAEHLQLTEVPCIRLEYLTETQKRAYVIADNKLGLNAGWDEELLNIELTDLHEDGFDVGMIGFEADELSELMGYNDKEVVEDEVPEPPAEPITKPGDLWVLGEHRLLCGDSTKAEDVERLMAGAKAEITISDPPYGIGYQYADHDDSDNDDNAELVRAAFALGAEVKVWTPGLHNLARDVSRFGTAKVAVWFKKFAAAGNGLGGASVWEPILIVGRPAVQSLRTDVIECMTERETIDGKSLRELHSCPKPVKLYVHIMEAFTEKGAAIHEPFCGSGTTLIAAEQLGRKCYGMEISPAYCDVIVKRWETLTGKKAVLENA